VPVGGTTNQVLAKINAVDYNTQWVNQTGGGGSASITVSDSAPSSPSNGALWWDSDAGLLLMFFVDAGGGAGQWVVTTPIGLADAPSDGNKYVRQNGAWVIA